ncbi:TonB-dependent receptor [Dyadobacter tibetensis]|uniref:TonB-dependent receptor n=1 Tax=Dyadobacter tibetensis TaxID=1211851 RepID=UPI0004723A3D|nr:TonB-dependent receptor [Dyadobacter tibetensis]
MYNSLQIPIFLWTIMKISFQQFVLLLLFSGLTYARDALGQELLKTNMTIMVKEVPLKAVLHRIEKKAPLHFVYSSSSINIHQKVSVNVEARPLDEILGTLLTPLSIGYRISENRIMLYESQQRIIPPAMDKLKNSPPQLLDVKGEVIDEKGMGLPGVNILLKGTSIGTTTDAEGAFFISIPRNILEPTLMISFIGYESQMIALDNKDFVSIQLQPDVQALGEVVVVGYGTQKKSDLTGSVARANIDAFRESPNVNLAQSLQGTVPGLNIGQVTSAGQSPAISVRGRTTINGNQNVLLVVDGIIFSGSMSDLNPADIESVDVLKDPSSMAIYGAQAANGVILITTKSGGKESKPVFNYSGSYSTQNPSNALTLLDREGFLKKSADIDWKKSFLAPDYTTPNPDYTYLDVVNDPPLREGFENGSNYNWWDNTTGPGFIISHNLSVRGAGERTSYFLSGGYTKQKGFVMNDKFQRITTRINIENKVFDWFKVGTQTFASFSDFSGVAPNLYGITIMSPLVKPTNEDGSFILNPNGTNNANPFLVAQAADYDKRNSLFGNVYANIDLPFIRGLSYRLNYGHTLAWTRHFGSNPYSNGAAGEAFKINSNSYDWTLDHILNYKKNIGENHKLDLTVVAGRRERNYENTNATGSNFTNLRLKYHDLSLGAIKNISSSAWDESYIYQTGRINYEFKYKYLLTATLRRDGFSGFAENAKTALFPSVGLGWVLSEESFMRSPAINLLKLRSSYGTNGNLVNRYASLARLNMYPAYVFGDGGGTEFGQMVTTLANPDLSWETTTGFNFGLDFAILKNRVSGNLDFYSTKTNDLIFDVNIPEVTGFNKITSNVGKIANRGAELVLNGKLISKREFSWDINFNIASNQNKVVSLLGQDNDGDGKEDDLVASGLFIGQPLGAIYDYESEGIIQLGDSAPSGFFVGTHKIIDQNNDGFYDANDRVIRGKKEAAYNFGILNELKYRNFNFRFFINSIQGGRQGYLGLNMPTSLGIGDNIRRNNLWKEFDYWTPSNPNARYRGLDQGPATEYNVYGNRSFVRLQDITLSYNIDKEKLEALHIQDIKLFVSAKNLATWTNWVGWDPETGSGLDANGRPVMRAWTLGINLRF